MNQEDKILSPDYSQELSGSTHMPHPTKFQATLIDKLTEIVNSSMMLFHCALELHWNYQGPNFIGVHHFLDAHYKMLLSRFDEVAERAVTMGGVMKLIPAMHKHDTSHAINIDHYLCEAEKFCAQLKSAISVADEDAVTHDLFVQYLAVLEKDVWQLRSTLGQPSDRTLADGEFVQ